ncbi:hypothetical protein PIB30_078797 [Stylosanthes scabra]|uniref:Uncharacterized protein n=1 Tax=Stylosanthes scabra TaxID=79078 RepID=A0ABU6RR58_9FABA|nr:hypothetical protein [Stylosanthes scabra]
MASKEKGKIYGPPTRASPRLAALRAQLATSALGRKPRMHVKYLTKQLAARDAPPNIGSTSQIPIAISSDSEKGDPETDSAEEPKEVAKYMPEIGPAENQDLEEEEPKGSGADRKIDPNLDSEEEEDPKEEEEEDPEEEEEPQEEHEIEEEQKEAERDPNDDYEFQDYVELAPPASANSSDDSTPSTDD